MEQKELSRIKSRERRRLRKYLKDSPISTKGAVESLIEELTDLKGYMAQVKELLEETGFIETYQNGANQFGRKKSIPLETLSMLQKNYSTLHGRLAALIVADMPEEGSE
jgi:hypothetical protein